MTKYQKYKLIIISLFSIFFLLILYNYSLNGRYTFKDDSLIILDTKTGTIYVINGKKYLKIDEYSKAENADSKK